MKVVPGALLRVSMRTATPKYSKLVYTAPKSGKSASPRSLTLAATLLYGGRDAESYALAKTLSLTEATTMGFSIFCSS